MTALTTERPELEAPEPQPAATIEPARGWSFPARFGLRFALAFIIQLDLVAFLSLLPYVGDYAYSLWAPIAQRFIPFLTTTFFHIAPAGGGPTGSGDGAYSYAQTAVYALLALVIATVWSLLDRRRIAYPRTLEVLRVCVRVVLAEAMIGYGASKIVPSQFPVPALDKLVQPLGDFSPMGLLWAFMGFSPGYTIFTGAAELFSGVLLTIRRTTLLGALMSIAVLVNVVALNLFYDVPVKLYSAQLLLLAIFLTIPHLSRLLNFFVLNRPVTPDLSQPLLRNRWGQVILVVLRTLLVAWFVVTSIRQSHDWLQEARGTHSPLRGIWNVASVTVDGVERPPVVSDLTRWRRLVFDYPAFMSLYEMNDRRQRFNVKLDEQKHTLALTSRDNPARTALLTYDRKDANTLLITGKLDGHDIRAVCQRGDEHFFLTERGFHWVNEKPLNR
jgi:hypothetical protein